MTSTVFVRYPDKTKDNPDTPEEPNPAIEIAAVGLADYRSRGFVQCNADGSKVDKASDGTPEATAEPVKLAGPDDDEFADAAKELAKADPGAQGTAKAPATGSDAKTGKGDA